MSLFLLLGLEEVEASALTPSHQVLAGLLLGLGLLGLVAEAFHRAWVPGLLGLGLLAVFAFMSSAGLPLALLAGGVLLILFEAYVAPGHGVSLALGLILIALSLYLALGPGALVVGGLGLLILLVGGGLLLVFFPRSLGRRLVLEGRLEGNSLSDEELQGLLEALEGQSGLAVTDLRPGGRARFGSRELEVVSQSGYIRRGEPVRVLRVEGSRILVGREESP